MHKKCFAIVSMLTLLLVLVGVVPTSAAPNEGNIVHVVQYGDTLYSIGRRYGVSVWSITSVNNIVNPNHIYVGQRLIIPTGQSHSGVIHVVRAGETLLRIALRYGVNAWTIARANGITNLNHIYVGQRLVIPRYVPKPTPPPTPPSPCAPPSCPTPQDGPWSAEYFNNATPTGTPYATRSDANVNFNWGWGAPMNGMPTDCFSVRWKGTFHFDAGTWRFSARVDDGVRVYVDGTLLVDGWSDGGYRLYAKELALAAGDHEIQVEYYDHAQVARIHFWWQAVSVASTPTPTPVDSSSGDGWFGQFYNNRSMAGNPFYTLHTPRIEFDWGTDSPTGEAWGDNFSARFTSKIHLNTDHYRFCTMSDDGVRIWLGDDLVLDAWYANNGETPVCVDHWVETGTYDAKVEYYEDGGNAMLYVWWEPH